MEIDPRGPRFSAVITTIVLAVVLVTGNAWLLGAQVAVFAVGALAGLRYAPYGLLYRYLIRPRLGPKTLTRMARTARARPAPASAGRQPRTTPTARTIVRASTHSTDDAREDASSVVPECALAITITSRCMRKEDIDTRPKCDK